MILQDLRNLNASLISVTSGRKSIRPSIAQQWRIKKQHSESQKFETMSSPLHYSNWVPNTTETTTRSYSNWVQVPRGISPRALDGTAIYEIKMCFSESSFPFKNAWAYREHLDNANHKRCGIIYFVCYLLWQQLTWSRPTSSMKPQWTIFNSWRKSILISQTRKSHRSTGILPTPLWRFSHSRQQTAHARSTTCATIRWTSNEVSFCI